MKIVQVICDLDLVQTCYVYNVRSQKSTANYFPYFTKHRSFLLPLSCRRTIEAVLTFTASATLHRFERKFGRNCVALPIKVTVNRKWANQVQVCQTSKLSEDKQQKFYGAVC